MKSEAKYQVRRHGGELLWFDDLDKAFLEMAGDYDKISWTEGGGRIILRRDHTWEYWTAEAFAGIGLESPR